VFPLRLSLLLGMGLVQVTGAGLLQLIFVFGKVRWLVVAELNVGLSTPDFI